MRVWEPRLSVRSLAALTAALATFTNPSVRNIVTNSVFITGLESEIVILVSLSSWIVDNAFFNPVADRSWPMCERIVVDSVDKMVPGLAPPEPASAKIESCKWCASVSMKEIAADPVYFDTAA